MRNGLIGLLLLIAGYASCHASTFGMRVGLGGEVIPIDGFFEDREVGVGINARLDLLIGRYT